jgi:hypothetical protein
MAFRGKINIHNYQIEKTVFPKAPREITILKFDDYGY